MSYKPSYTWPNPAFPFRLYYDSSECRIFIIENIQHNWDWMSVYSKYFRESDYFFVYCGWYHSEQFAKEADLIFSELNLNRNNFFIMYNSPKEMNNFSPFGFRGEVINHNAWLDENLVMKVMPNVEKEYDALYIARLSAFKRHELAGKVNNLALVAGINHGNPINQKVPHHVYKNTSQLTPQEVCVKINESKCGLILSALEGACFSSSEYLLCGIPVVSTLCEGGRDVWYNEYNSLVVEPNEVKIADAVEFFISERRDPFKIRNAHIAQAQHYRNLFINEIGNIFFRHGVYTDSREYFADNYFHKLRKSYKPKLEKLFY